MKSNDGLSRLPRASPSSTTIPLKRKHLDDAPSDTIDCICGSPHEDGGLSIACDTCSRWCHAACFHITDDDVPEKWQCFVCCPHNVDRDKAGKPHRSRPRTTNGESSHHTTRARATTRGRRRGLSAATAPHNHPALVEDTPVDIDGPSWQDTYVHITDDIVLHASTRDRLRRQAQHWRGITALCADSPAPTSPVFIPDNPPSLSSGSATTVHRLSQTTAFHPNVAPCIDPSVRSPTYAIRISKSTPSASLITQYKSSIIPSSVYLSDPSNCYAHLSLPKPYVHLFGPPLDVALDSRITGDESRFVRNGCKPNAVLRPMVCGKDKRNGDNGQGLEFGVFALRDLKADEEVVLGWEWDDGSVVHQLPALIKYPDLFPCVFLYMYLSFANLLATNHAFPSYRRNITRPTNLHRTDQTRSTVSGTSSLRCCMQLAQPTPAARAARARRRARSTG
ncbi:hypothetical protein OE88DRAFT_1639695 [Heliocybe sulcata]|uniref:PHD-type domain-containing protein n=1 Tax=Heliocybe sulcata TaxID=5364 RepID=A0A5C3MJW9_9AGAM|nr:hypothetical protein OE88DRAFT_1639695 [Heliocybe sulcata]